MNHKIRTLILLLATGILAISCQEEGGYPATYYFGSRANIAFSEVTSTNTPGLRELAEMLTQKRDEIKKDFQFDWMVTSSGNTREAAMENAVGKAIASFTSSIVTNFDLEMQSFGDEFTSRKQELSQDLSREAGSVKFTVHLYLTAEDAIAQGYEMPLAVSRTYTFECRGKNESY
jgi:hypothetical protein